MILLQATRRLLKGSDALSRSDALSGSDAPSVEGPLSTWYATTVALPYPGRSLVLFSSAETLVSVVAPGRSLRTTLPVFQQRVPRLLRRLRVPEAWVAARAADLAQVHVTRAGALTTDRRVLGTMADLRHQIRADATAAGAFDRLDLDAVEDGLAEVPLTVLGTGGGSPRSHGTPEEAIAALAGAGSAQPAARAMSPLGARLGSSPVEVPPSSVRSPAEPRMSTGAQTTGPGSVDLGKVDLGKVDDAALALLWLTAWRDAAVPAGALGPDAPAAEVWRAWKGLDWDVLDRLHAAGYLDDPKTKAKSVRLTPEGRARSEALFETLFGRDDGGVVAGQSRT